MTRLGKFEKVVEVVSKELNEQRNVNTAVVGGMDTGKDFSVIIPNILLEEEKNLVVIDPIDQISNVYTFKEKQGYHILTYNLEKEDILQQLNNDLMTKKEEKLLIHVTFPNEFLKKQEMNSQRVMEFLMKIKEMQDIKWGQEKSLHLFLMEYEEYASPEFHAIFQTWCGYRISTTLSVQHVLRLDDVILDNCHYVLYKRILDPQTAEWIAETLKYHHVEFLPKILGTNLLSLPLTAGMLMDLPINLGLLQKNYRENPYGNDSWTKFVETYNAEDILGRAL
ncbi:TPA: type IV secretory system conjugative DNA transfer family protein [Bacillus thuringiensis]|uniref:Protein TrsK n=1 Tax=Bacillus thuringiensis serovar iberica TaxID=180866 RepID=A0A9X6LJV3_BACTU|nr:type IV secretory system conjugative DNA transfer family protein [Bacillus thuringiensis]MEB9625104.1 type IV secretory system conjugative DNA transfer family protein [Bacillus cereus]OUB46629.1 protein TrsK [Bacillus thuringiensis serovar iberica]HDR5352092.1 type IV secretory system conjugative DNA transfer family protein [Bacillus thuringiensis]